MQLCELDHNRAAAHDASSDSTAKGLKMEGVSAADLIALVPILLGTVLWTFLPPGRLRPTTEKPAGRHGGRDYDLREGLLGSALESSIAWPRLSS